MPEKIGIPSDFWEGSDYSSSAYVLEPVSDTMLESVQLELGYSLPASYVALMRTQNGGSPRLACYRTTSGTSWAADFVWAARRAKGGSR